MRDYYTTIFFSIHGRKKTVVVDGILWVNGESMEYMRLFVFYKRKEKKFNSSIFQRL